MQKRQVDARQVFVRLAQAKASTTPRRRTAPIQHRRRFSFLRGLNSCFACRIASYSSCETSVAVETQRAHIPLFTGRHPDRRKAIFNQQLHHERGISSIALLFPRFGRANLRLMAHLAINPQLFHQPQEPPHRTVASIPTLVGPAGVEYNSRTDPPSCCKVFSTISLVSTSTSQPSVVALGPHTFGSNII